LIIWDETATGAGARHRRSIQRALRAHAAQSPSKTRIRRGKALASAHGEVLSRRVVV
jgi:hypothetical protein